MKSIDLLTVSKVKTTSDPLPLLFNGLFTSLNHKISLNHQEFIYTGSSKNHLLFIRSISDPNNILNNYALLESDFTGYAHHLNQYSYYSLSANSFAIPFQSLKTMPSLNLPGSWKVIRQKFIDQNVNPFNPGIKKIPRSLTLAYLFLK